MIIEKKGSRLTIGAMKFEGLNVAKKSFDLKNYAGKRIRVHIGIDGKYTIAEKARQKLLICELEVPTRSFESEEMGELGGDGKKEYRSVPKIIQLDNVPLKKYVAVEEIKKRKE